MKGLPFRPQIRLHLISWVSLWMILLWVLPAYSAWTPALLSGTVTNAVTGTPVIGAKIQVNNAVAYSVSGGFYSLSVEPVGTYAVTSTKPGFDPYASQPVTFQQGVSVVHDISLLEATNPPGGVLATLDTALQTVHLNWTAPSGEYEMIYDDGIQENFTLWALQGNMNAVRFTPLAFPAIITGGSVHIGTIGNYTPGSNPLVPFQVAVYNASGAGGMPGAMIAGPFSAIPSGFGWNEFVFPAGVTVQSGSFYLVMIQGGNSPNACGIAVDETAPKFRSVSRFITGGGPWIPASGNFLMRAVVEGGGGPLDLLPEQDAFQSYEVWRLRQGEEQNPGIWTSLGMTPDPFLSDPEWFNFPCGPYRYAVKAGYSNNRQSVPAFSNILGKCWTAATLIDTDPSCEAGGNSGTTVRLKNLVYPDTCYTGITDTSGTVLFPLVWKGNYELKITKFGYQSYTGNLPLGSDTTVVVPVLQVKSPPREVEVDAKSLVVHWQPPLFEQEQFLEDWSSGDFSAGSWTIQGGFNWTISTSNGNPAPSAMFYWSPHATNYSQSLISRDIPGDNAPQLELNYDIFFDNFGTTTLNQMAVEIWDGSGWTLLRNYQNSTGSFPWTTERLDISSWSGSSFRFRFRAYGEDTYDIDSWNIDNINVHASETPIGMTTCVIGYNVYLDQVLAGFTPDTKFTLPPTLVTYGNSYEACVNAVYGSGQSEKDCKSFTASFLYPPENLTAEIIENAVELEWSKPQMPDTGNTMITPPGLSGYKIYRNDVLIKSIGDPDSLLWYDMGLEPGSYSYTVSAWYDLSYYGFPGRFDESMRAGPVSLQVNFGRPLPFYESWDQASFTFNEWTFVPTQGNWQITTVTGNPLPSAQFSWEPILANYAHSLESPVLDATPVTCGRIMLDFDVILGVLNATGQERLMVEVYYDNFWFKVAEFANDSSFDWTARSIDISFVAGHGFAVRFTAKGVSSADILQWSVDNIGIYAVCKAPDTLLADAMGYDVHLSWTPPDCSGGSMNLNEDFEGDVFPPPGWDQLITNAASSWSHTGKNSPVGVYEGNYSAGIIWDYMHQDEWLIAEDIEISGNLEFWSYAFQGSVHGDHYYVKISTDNGNTWTTLFDLTAQPPYPGPGGYNQWETPYEIDLSGYTGQVASLAWHAIDGDGQGLWYSWGIDNCMVGGKKISFMDSGDQLLGYNVFRKGPADPDFVRITPNTVSDTSYVDPGLEPGYYEYFILPVFTECTKSDTSDVASVDVITSISSPGESRIRLYPVPAHDFITVEIPGGTMQASGILENAEGKVLSVHPLDDRLPNRIDVRNLPSGMYFLKIISPTFFEVKKILVH